MLVGTQQQVPEAAPAPVFALWGWGRWMGGRVEERQIQTMFALQFISPPVEDGVLGQNKFFPPQRVFQKKREREKMR